MAKNPHNLAGSFDTDDTGGLLSGFLAEEDEVDRRALWRLGSWGVGAVGAVIVAVLANQSQLSLRREQVAAADLIRQAQQIQAVARESQNQARQLASAIDTLNGDRDRLYSRVSTLEQGLDSVTGAIARQATPAPSPLALAPAAAADPPAAQPPVPAPAVAPVATTPIGPPAPEKTATADKPTSADKPTATEKPVAATKPAVADKTATAEKPEATDKPPAAEKLPVMAATDPNPPGAPSGNPDTTKSPAATPAAPLVVSKSIMAPPDPAAGTLIETSRPADTVTASPIPEVAAVTPANDEEAAPKAAVQKTQFGVDVGSANSVAGLRALWRGLMKSRSNTPLFPLQPIIVIKEGSNGLGMQLRLVAGPLNDAGEAAKICAVLTENRRACETAIFDGQRLSLKADDAQPPAAAKPAPRHRSYPKRAAVPTAAVVEEPRKPESTAMTTISSMFGRKTTQ